MFDRHCGYEDEMLRRGINRENLCVCVSVCAFMSVPILTPAFWPRAGSNHCELNALCAA